MAHIKWGYEIIEDASKRSSEVTKGIAEELNDAEFIFKIDDLIKARGISQRQLSEISGIPLSYLSDLILNKTTTINKVHLMSLMSVLRVDSITDIIEIKLPDNIAKVFEVDRSEWIDTKQLPENVMTLAMKATELRHAKDTLK